MDERRECRRSVDPSSYLNCNVNSLWTVVEILWVYIDVNKV